MAFDKNKPAGSQELRKSDDEIRENWASLESALSEGHEFATGGNQTGKHTNPIWKDMGGDPSQPTGTNEVRIANNAETLVGIRQSDGGILGFGTERGAKSIFKQSSAPLGWNFVSEDNDRALINTSTESEGGGTGGSWTIGLSVDNHTLSTSEIPNITGSATFFNTQDTDILKDGTGAFSVSNDGGESRYVATQSKSSTRKKLSYDNGGGNGSHNHGISGDDGSWRPSYAKVITCEKA